MMRTWNSFWFRPQSPTILACGRILFFALLYWYYPWPISLEWGDMATWKDVWEPVSFFKFLHIDHISRVGLERVCFFWRACMIFSCIGFLTRLSTAGAFLSSLLCFGLPLNFGKIHHSNHTIVVVMGILAFSRCGDALSLDAILFRKKNGVTSSDFRWPVQLIRVYTMLIYFEAAFQKLRETGFKWITADNMQGILLSRPTVTPLGLWVSHYDWACFGLAAWTVFVELFAITSIFDRRFAYFFVPSCFMLHWGTWWTMGAHGAFFCYMFCYAFWVPWEHLWAFVFKKIGMSESATSSAGVTRQA